MYKTVLEMRNIWKSFSGNVVLRDVNFTVRLGEVHGILGENGAGKSTLMKILMGIYSKDSGTLLLDGEEIDIQSPKQALELGISMIHQELNPVLDLTSENFWVKRLQSMVSFSTKRCNGKRSRSLNVSVFQFQQTDHARTQYCSNAAG